MIWLLTALWLLMPASALACPAVGEPITDKKGNVLVGAQVYIYLANTSTLAQLYSDSSCTFTTTNPATTNDKGMFTVYIPDGAYDIQPVKTGYVVDRVEDVLLEDRYTILAPTYSSSITLNRAGAQRHIITATNNSNFTITAPSGTVGVGSPLWVVIRNASGGALGTITWDAIFKKSTFTAPADLTQRSILFYWNGTDWIQDIQSAADITY